MTAAAVLEAPTEATATHDAALLTLLTDVNLDPGHRIFTDPELAPQLRRILFTLNDNDARITRVLAAPLLAGLSVTAIRRTQYRRADRVQGIREHNAMLITELLNLLETHGVPREVRAPLLYV